jgi:hypothetical protein
MTTRAYRRETIIFFAAISLGFCLFIVGIIVLARAHGQGIQTDLGVSTITLSLVILGLNYVYCTIMSARAKRELTLSGAAVERATIAVDHAQARLEEWDVAGVYSRQDS